jgi:hypothetical protein
MGSQSVPEPQNLVLNEPIVVFLGDFQNDRLLLDEVDGHLGWRFCQVPTSEALANLIPPLSSVTAVYLDQVSEKNLAEELSAIRNCVPEARIVVCYPLRSPVMAEELVSAGAFHSLPKPLHMGELKQSLGFVWEACSRSRAAFATGR